MSAGADRQVFPAVVLRRTVHVVLPRRADHDIALIHDDAFTFELNEALTRDADDDLPLVMHMRWSLGTGGNLDDAHIEFITRGGALQPGQVQARRS